MCGCCDVLFSCVASGVAAVYFATIYCLSPFFDL